VAIALPDVALHLKPQGAFHGLIPTPGRCARRCGERCPAWKIFYMAGQWSLGGGGVPPCCIQAATSFQICASATGKIFFDQLPLKNFGDPPKPGAPLDKNLRKIISPSRLRSHRRIFCTARSDIPATA